MDIVPTLFSHEASAWIKDIAGQVERGELIGSFSLAVYDTAWLAMIVKRGDNPTLLFPESLRYLLDTQEPDGAWPQYSSDVDGILNTMAATIALRNVDRRPELHHREPSLALTSTDVSSRVIQAKQALRARLNAWDVASSVHVGFEILVPTLLELLEEDDESFEFPGRQVLMSLNRAKLAKFRPEILYGKYQTTLIHSLEAFAGRIDFDKVAHHLDRYGSMMASPSATAAYLMYSSQWDENAERYLRLVVAQGSGKGNGGVPSAYPSSTFEVSWIASTLLKAGLSPDVLGMKETETVRSYIQAQLDSHNGIVGFDTGLLADVDDTAKSIVSANLLGLPYSPARMVDEFETESHFRTYKGERNASLSANCNALDALLHCPNPSDYTKQIVKVTEFLCNLWYAQDVQDKWNLSEHYSLMLLSQALVKLLQNWDSGRLSALPRNLIHERIPLVLFQICIRTLCSQSSDGWWGLDRPSCEISAYAILTLKAVLPLPWLAHFQPRITEAVKRGCAFLVINHDNWGLLDRIWVEKVTYALPPLTKTYCIAALCAKSSFDWSEKVANLAVVSWKKVTKLAGFFSMLPMFSRDKFWLLEADVAEGMLFLPQLMSVSDEIFPRQENINYQYLEYIPFTWLSTNRQNGYPLSNNLLWETMMIALLDYQLDEFMEIVFGQDEELRELDAIKSIVRRLCRFPEPVQTDGANGFTESRTNGNEHINGHNRVNGDGHVNGHGHVNGNGLTNGHNHVNSNGLANGHAHTNGHGHTNGHNHADKRKTDGTATNGISSVHVNGKKGSTASTTLQRVETILVRFTSYVFRHPKVVQSPEHIRRNIHRELETCMLAHLEHDEDNASLAKQKRDHQAPINATPSPAANTIVALRNPRNNFYSWVRNISADNTHSPFTFAYFSCLASPVPGEPFFKGPRQHYLSSALSRHLANMCRLYNDYGSVARDHAESNVNSLNFPEFHESDAKQDISKGSGNLKLRDEFAMKKDLFFIAEYERQCLDHAIDLLDKEMCVSKQGILDSSSLKAFIDTVDLYGQIYVARDITNRVK